MTDARRHQLDELHYRVLKMADARWHELHRQLAEVIECADDIRPSKAPMRSVKEEEQ